MRYWKRVDGNRKTTTVESYSHDLDIEKAIEITQVEFDIYVTSLPKPVFVPTRNLEAEIDALKIQVAALSK